MPSNARSNASSQIGAGSANEAAAAPPHWFVNPNAGKSALSTRSPVRGREDRQLSGPSPSNARRGGLSCLRANRSSCSTCRALRTCRHQPRRGSNAQGDPRELEHDVAPDVLVLVLDASNLEQHLVFALEVIELGKPCLVALNMLDLAERDGLTNRSPALESNSACRWSRPWRCGAAGSTRSPPQSSRPRSAPPNRAIPTSLARAAG